MDAILTCILLCAQHAYHIIDLLRLRRCQQVSYLKLVKSVLASSSCWS